MNRFKLSVSTTGLQAPVIPAPPPPAQPAPQVLQQLKQPTHQAQQGQQIVLEVGWYSLEQNIWLKF